MHIDRELELLLSGKKPLAMFYGMGEADMIYDRQAFANAVRRGWLKQRRVVQMTPDGPGIHVFYTRPGNAWRLAAGVMVATGRLGRQYYFDAAHDIRIGRLLGYPEWQIRAFVRRRALTVLQPRDRAENHA